MPTPEVVVYTECNSPRLRYVLDWIFKERLGITYKIKHGVHDPADTYSIGYGVEGSGVSIFASGFLWDTGIKQQNISLQEWEGMKVLYYAEDNGYAIPFDLFGSVFYLLSRYEEYLDFEPDEHGRFHHSKSILNGMLEVPIVDEWIDYFRRLLERILGVTIPTSKFSFEATYDIDIAWAYRNKGLKRIGGAVVKDIATLHFGKVAERFSKDPYDSFEWIQRLHKQCGVRPKYFILSALEVSPFDKNISPRHPAMAGLISDLAKEGEIGIHPSYYTLGNEKKLKEEKALLEGIIGQPVVVSRQHYIRLVFPDTYRQLISVGVNEDYSMGYSTHVGFRAGTSHSFNWYDMEAEAVTELRVFPFCFMDTTARFDMKLSAEEAFARLNRMADYLNKNGGLLITIFHNFSLGTDKGWAGWAERYEDFIKNSAKAYF